MEKKRLAIASIIILVLSFILLLSFRDFVRETIVVPLAYLVWLGGLIIRSIHQLVLWILLVVAIAVVMFLSLRPKGDRKIRDALPEHQRYRRDRVISWSRRIYMTSPGLYKTRYFSLELRRFLMNLLAYRENMTVWEVENRIRAAEKAMTEGSVTDQSAAGKSPARYVDDLNIPPEIMRILHTRWMPDFVKPLSFFARLSYRIKRYTQSQRGEEPEMTDPDLDILVDYLETLMEVQHDHPNL